MTKNRERRARKTPPTVVNVPMYCDLTNTARPVVVIIEWNREKQMFIRTVGMWSLCDVKNRIRNALYIPKTHSGPPEEPMTGWWFSWQRHFPSSEWHKEKASRYLQDSSYSHDSPKLRAGCDKSIFLINLIEGRRVTECGFGVWVIERKRDEERERA